MADEPYIAGSRYDSYNPVLLNMQGGTGTPLPSELATITGPLLPSVTTTERLRHFFEGIYDLSPSSHLSRFLKVILGDAGIGGLSKQYMMARQQSTLLTTHYGDLDLFYGGLLGLRRLTAETLGMSPYTDLATPEQWAILEAKDSAYRARIETFVRSLPITGTPDGMAALGYSILGVECRVYETYMTVDDLWPDGAAAGAVISGGTVPAVSARTYGQIESDFHTYSMMIGTYADIAGGHGAFVWSDTKPAQPALITLNRSEFVVVPKREISLEEHYAMTRVLGRFKPANSLMRIDPNGAVVHTLAPFRQVYADSTYWEVSARVVPNQTVDSSYVLTSVDGVPQAQPVPAFSGYQGEAWSYNADISSVVSYTADEAGYVRDRFDYERIRIEDANIDFSPDKAIQDHATLLRGRAVSDGILALSPYDARGRSASSYGINSVSPDLYSYAYGRL